MQVLQRLLYGSFQTATGYHISSHVQNDCVARYGVGVYHYFRDAAVTVRSAIVAPTALEPYFVSPLSVARLATRAFGGCMLCNLRSKTA